MKYVSIAVFALSFGLHLYGLAAGWSTSFLYFSTVTRIDCLAIGSLLAVSTGFREWLGKYALAFLLIAVAWAVITTSQRLDFLSHDLGAASLVALSLTQSTPLLRAGWLRSFGKYSYALYVIHYPISGLEFFNHNWASPRVVAFTAIVGGIGISFLLAKLSWKFLEEPFLLLKGRFNYHYGPRAIQPSPMPDFVDLQAAKP
jgi:peptidoglycan/LPS O-acetylase OafA/YrhL